MSRISGSLKQKQPKTFVWISAVGEERNFAKVSGYIIALNKFKDYTLNAINSMPSDILNLLLIGGFGQGLGYLFGAFSFYIGLNTLNKLTFVMPR